MRGRGTADEGADDAEFGGDEDGYQPGPLEKPYTRAGGKQEKEEPQKWVQCANCSLWRKARICSPAASSGLLKSMQNSAKRFVHFVCSFCDFAIASWI